MPRNEASGRADPRFLSRSANRRKFGLGTDVFQSTEEYHAEPRRRRDKKRTAKFSVSLSILPTERICLKRRDGRSNHESFFFIHPF